MAHFPHDHENKRHEMSVGATVINGKLSELRIWDFPTWRLEAFLELGRAEQLRVGPARATRGAHWASKSHDN